MFLVIYLVNITQILSCSVVSKGNCSEGSTDSFVLGGFSPDVFKGIEVWNNNNFMIQFVVLMLFSYLFKNRQHSIHSNLQLFKLRSPRQILTTPLPILIRWVLRSVMPYICCRYFLYIHCQVFINRPHHILLLFSGLCGSPRGGILESG